MSQSLRFCILIDANLFNLVFLCNFLRQMTLISSDRGGSKFGLILHRSRRPIDSRTLLTFNWISQMKQQYSTHCSFTLPIFFPDNCFPLVHVFPEGRVFVRCLFMHLKCPVLLSLCRDIKWLFNCWRESQPPPPIYKPFLMSTASWISRKSPLPNLRTVQSNHCSTKILHLITDWQSKLLHIYDSVVLW